MNYLDLESKAQIVSMLVDGCSIRAVERITGHHRDTIGRVAYRIGMACSQLHDRSFRNLSPRYIQLDEIWSFVGKKQKRCVAGEVDAGDQYVFLALDQDTKALITWHIGKRTQAATEAFVSDLASRIINIPQITSDAFQAYEEALYRSFGEEFHYAQVVKNYSGYAPAPFRKYSPTHVVGITKRKICGTPIQSRITTAHIERQNLQVRMGLRRFTRLTNAFSRKVERHAAAVSLYVTHHNFCKSHAGIGLTPAMIYGLADKPWSVEDLITYLEPDRPVMASRNDWRGLYTPESIA